MSVRRIVLLTVLVFSLASLAFSVGSWSAHRTMARQLADNDAQLVALRDDMAEGILEMRQARAPRASGTDGERRPAVVPASGADRAVDSAAPQQNALVEEIKRQLQSEMGLLPVRLLRERRESFVELNANDNSGKTSYGTAGYLGDGYFITVKHGVVALDEDDPSRRITSIRVRVRGKDRAATVVDAGDATVEVHSGDWAIIRVRGEVDLPPLHVKTEYAYDFAEPIFRLGNDYSKGILLGTGYVGQRTSNGLVTCLTDGLPACPAAACWTRAVSSWASPSAACRATTASRSSCPCVPRCSARCRRSPSPKQSRAGVLPPANPARGRLSSRGLKPPLYLPFGEG